MGDDTSSLYDSSIYRELAFVHSSMRNFSKSIECFNKYKALEPGVCRKSSRPDLAPLYSNMGLAYEAHADYTTALEYHKKCLAIQHATYRDKQHPDIATSYRNLGSVYKA